MKKLYTIIFTVLLLFSLPAVLAFSANEPVLTAKNGKNAVELSWTGLGGADSYRIYRKTPDGKYKRLKIVGGGVLSFSDKTAEDGEKYVYFVRGYSGKTALRGAECSHVRLDAPKKPAAKSAEAGIRISVRDAKANRKYLLYRKQKNGKWKYIATVSGSKGYVDKSVRENTTYYYRLKAQQKNYSSAYSSAAASRHIACIRPSSAASAAGGVKIKWKRLSYADGYYVYRRKAGESGWKRLKKLSKGTLFYLDASAVSGVEYHYAVAAVSDGYEAAIASKRVAVYLSAPEKPGAVNNNKGRVCLGWAAVKGAQKYYIYRAQQGGSLKQIGQTSKCTFTDKTAVGGRIYYYRVRAAAGKSAKSALSEKVRGVSIDINGKLVALTYDDGPSNERTGKILNVLERYGAKATFFVVGSRIQANSQALKRAAQLGCEIGNHTYSHATLTRCSAQTIKSEISKTDALVKKYTGNTCSVARAPGGSSNQSVRLTAGKPFIFWSIDTRDWEHRSSSRTVSIIKSSVRDGSIVLMHDIHECTVTSSEQIIPWLVQRGYQLVTVSELMRYRGIELKAGETYSCAY